MRRTCFHIVSFRDELQGWLCIVSLTCGLVTVLRSAWVVLLLHSSCHQVTMDRWLKTGCLKRKTNTEKCDEPNSERSACKNCDETHSHSGSSANDKCDEECSDMTATDNCSNTSISEQCQQSASFIKHSAAKKTKTARKYDKSYLKLGFSWTGDEVEPVPLCVICYETLTNESMKPSHLKRHFDSKHQSYKEKPVEFFENRHNDFIKSVKTMHSITVGENMKAMEASYGVALLIAKSGAAEVKGETLVKPAAKLMAQLMIGEKASKAVDTVPLSNNTVHRRILDMADNVKHQLLLRVRQSRYYALQADESTDIGSLANLLVYVRYECNTEFYDDLLFCRPVPTNTTGEAVFQVIDTFIKESDLDWSRCVGISTDGARAMVGSNKGVVTRIRAVAPYAKATHCCIHRQALATKSMHADLKQVLDEAVKIINHVKGRPLNARLFSQLCDEMGSDYTQLLFHTEVRWLSRGKVLTRLFQLREELLVFLDETFILRHRMYDWDWLCRLAYLADVFGHLNNLNLSLQGKLVSVFHVQDKVSAMIAKLRLWHRRLNCGEFDAFPSLHELVINSELNLNTTVLESMKQHVDGLQQGLRQYFPEQDGSFEWIRNPFNVSVQTMPNNLSNSEEEQLLELASDGFLKLQFQQDTLTSFWLRINSEYPSLSEKAVKYLMPFPTSYLCEVGFSALVAIKTKK